MADRNWRKSPSIQEAKRVAQALGKTAVIMVMVDEVEGTLELATYGTTGPRCTVAGKLGDAAYDAVMQRVHLGSFFAPPADTSLQGIGKGPQRK